jgi:hypothetical protein
MNDLILGAVNFNTICGQSVDFFCHWTETSFKQQQIYCVLPDFNVN